MPLIGSYLCYGELLKFLFCIHLFLYLLFIWVDDGEESDRHGFGFFSGNRSRENHNYENSSFKMAVSW